MNWLRHLLARWREERTARRESQAADEEARFVANLRAEGAWAGPGHGSMLNIRQRNALAEFDRESDAAFKERGDVRDIRNLNHRRGK